MTVRSVPIGFAPLLELLELEQPRVVTTAQIGDLAQVAGLCAAVDIVVRRLRERGWLLPLATKGVWEFAPAARAGAFGSGDPLIELRAILARDPEAPFVVAAESAAYLLGLSSRRPEVESVSAPQGVRVPTGLAGYHVVRWSPVVAPVLRDGLPVWTVETLLAFMATRPSGYRDWPNVGEWLTQAPSTMRVGDLAGELEGRSAGSWARAAYLLDMAGASEAARVLGAHAPAGSGPYYLGDRSRPGKHSGIYDVIDSTGVEVGAQ